MKKQIGSLEPQVKKLSFLSIYLLGINGVIGSGAFLLPSKVYQQVGTSSILLIVFAGLMASLIALCYADMSGKFAGSGGAWLYAYHAFGRFSATEVGFFVWISGVVTISAEVSALFTTLQSFFPVFKDPIVYRGSAIALILCLGVLNFFGTKIVGFFNNISSLFKMGTILLFVIIGIFFIRSAHFEPFVAPVAAEKGVFSSFNQAFGVVFYMFNGFAFLPIVAGQMDKPEKNIPKAIVYVMTSCIALYALLQFVAIGIAGGKLGSYPYPIAQAFKDAIGGAGYVIILIGTLVAVLGVAISVSFETPALVSSLANEKHLLPRIVGKKNKNGAPIVAIVITILVSALLILSGDFIFLVSCIVFASFFQYVFTIFAVIKYKYLMRKAKKDGVELSDRVEGMSKEKGFILPGGYVIPILAILMSIYIFISFDVKVLLFGLIVFIIGIFVFFLTKMVDKKQLS